MDNKQYLVTGKGKLGSLLIGRPNFHFLDCDITDIESIDHAQYELMDSMNINFIDVVVNLAAISSVDECERDYDKAIKVNTHGLANLHKVFGERVLNISSDQVFSGNSLILPNEKTKPSPINNYGYTKLGAETVSQAFGGKTLRLSRTVSIEDNDIHSPIMKLSNELEAGVPTFFARNYMCRDFAVDAIEYMVRNWDDMPQIVNYGGLDHVTMFGFMKMLVMELGLDHTLLQKNNQYNKSMTPRPRNGGFKVGLAKELGFPMYNLSDTVERLKRDFNDG